MRVLAQFIKNSSRQLRSVREAHAREARILVQLNAFENSPVLYESLHTHTHAHITLTRLHSFNPLTLL